VVLANAAISALLSQHACILLLITQDVTNRLSLPSFIVYWTFLSSGYGQVAGTGNRGNDPSVSITYGEIFD